MMADSMKGLRRTHYCGEVTAEDICKEVVVAGWVQKARDLGNLIFIDLRDRTGVVQLAFDDATDRAVFEKAAGARSEYVLMARGVVRKRESINAEMKNGDIEIFAVELRILSQAQTPPFEITDKTNVKEELRLKYRYLDLRRRTLQQNIMLRHKIAQVTRSYFYENGFLEIETPMLMKSTPEGARDYLVPSRVHQMCIRDSSKAARTWRAFSAPCPTSTISAPADMAFTAASPGEYRPETAPMVMSSVMMTPS